MDIGALKKDFKDRICEQVEIHPEGQDRFVIKTPFRFEDGDHFSIYLKREGGTWVITDEASTMMHLSYDIEDKDLLSGNRGQIIESSLAGFSVRNREGELVIPVKDDRFGDALFSFIQAISKVSDVRFLSRERVRSTFIEDFQNFLRSKVPAHRLEFDWKDTALDPHGRYPVDARINSMERPLLVYALPSEEKVNIATISLLMFEKWHMRFQSLGIFEDQESLSSKAVARLTDVCGKMFSNLEGNRDRISLYLDEILTGK